MDSNWIRKRATGNIFKNTSTKRNGKLLSMTTILSFTALLMLLTTSSKSCTQFLPTESKSVTKLITIRINDEPSSVQVQQKADIVEPDYAKPTIAKKMKDHELDRIGDHMKQSNKRQMVVSHHNEMLRTERMNPDRYTKTRTGFGVNKNMEMASAHVLSQSKRGANRSFKQESTGEQPPLGDVKNVNVKTANKSIRVMKQEAQTKRDTKNVPGGI